MQKSLNKIIIINLFLLGMISVPAANGELEQKKARYEAWRKEKNTVTLITPNGELKQVSVSKQGSLDTQLLEELPEPLRNDYKFYRRKEDGTWVPIKKPNGRDSINTFANPGFTLTKVEGAIEIKAKFIPVMRFLNSPLVQGLIQATNNQVEQGVFSLVVNFRYYQNLPQIKEFDNVFCPPRDEQKQLIFPLANLTERLEQWANTMCLENPDTFKKLVADKIFDKDLTLFDEDPTSFKEENVIKYDQEGTTKYQHFLNSFTVPLADDKQITLHDRIRLFALKKKIGDYYSSAATVTEFTAGILGSKGRSPG